ALPAVQLDGALDEYTARGDVRGRGEVQVQPLAQPLQQCGWCQAGIEQQVRVVDRPLDRVQRRLEDEQESCEKWVRPIMTRQVLEKRAPHRAFATSELTARWQYVHAPGGGSSIHAL